MDPFHISRLGINAEVGLNYSRINFCRGRPMWDTTANIIFPYPFASAKKKKLLHFQDFLKEKKHIERWIMAVRRDKDVIFLVTHLAAVFVTYLLC